MVITVLIPNASEEMYSRVLAALSAAGIEKVEAHLQTPEQHSEHPIRPALGG
jgi:hypothetical protein